MKRSGLIFFGLIFLLYSLSEAAANPPQPANIKVFHRAGQTFITWSERSDMAGERYRIYRHSRPITSLTIGDAMRLYELHEGSARFFADRYNAGGSGLWQARYTDRFVVRDRGGRIAEDSGLLVWTLSASEAADSAAGYYAVTTVNRTGLENLTDFGPSNTFGPVTEKTADPRPVEALRGAGGRGHVYVQYMDLHYWNPTFHAPNAGNAYYGLNAADEAVSRSVQYAYTYTIGEPDPANCPDPMPSTLPVILNLHGWADNTYGPDAGASRYYCAFEIRPIDVSETWWFGFAKEHDYRLSSAVDTGDVIVNYTEWRVLRMVYDLLRDRTFGPRIDRNRVYVYGHSMGGSGTLALALRYPNVFAAAYASEPMTDYRTSALWEDDVTVKLGPVSLNLPVELHGPGDWASGLQAYAGTGAWDWQNHKANLLLRTGDEFVPFGVAHGRQDDIIAWPTQGRPAYAAFDDSRHAWGGAVVDSGHEWLGYQGLGPDLAPDGSLSPFYGLKVKKNETVPGLSGASGNLPLPPPNPPASPGGYNLTIEWSSGWDRWDGSPKDRENEWQMSFRTTDGSTQTVNVTPRRLKNFRTVSGESYIWENRRKSDNNLVARGTVSPDEHGLLTVTGFRVTPGGNRLSITAQRPWPDTSAGIHVFNDQLPEGMSETLVRFSAKHYAGTQKMTRSEADRLRAVNPDFLVLHYRLGPGLGYRATQNSCKPTGGWLRIIEGNNWVIEWPGNADTGEDWFFHWPRSGSTRVLNCDWGWYLMELNDPGYRSYWLDTVLRQLSANDNDGLFLDSLSVPNYLGASSYSPALPEINSNFENDWSLRIRNWLSWLRGQKTGMYYLIANVGSWITSRDSTDYSLSDGLMVEGFGMEADASPYAFSDWLLQMDRIVGSVGKGQALLFQTYVSGSRERMFTLGSYLLVKGSRSFINLESATEPDWWPEYDIRLGRPVQSASGGISELDPEGDHIFRRNFDNGFVLVNPTNPFDGSGVTRTIELGDTYYLAETSGGGLVPSSGIPTGSVSYRAVTSVTLRPYSAAVLLREQ